MPKERAVRREVGLEENSEENSGPSEEEEPSKSDSYLLQIKTQVVPSFPLEDIGYL